MRKAPVATFLAIVVFGNAMAAAAQTDPQPVPGEILLVPMSEVSPVVDGELGEWTGQPEVVTTGGPLPSSDPASTGELRWHLTAEPEALHFAATITDALISAGVTPDQPWNEDSIELYLNFSGEFQRTSYTDGVYQLRFSAVDLGKTDPTALTLTGIGLGELEITGVVFATADGWGIEARIDLEGLAALRDGSVFGVQVQANGSSGEGRDLKLSWSNADVNDVSFENPSVFGTAIVVDQRIASAEESAALAVDDGSTTTTTSSTTTTTTTTTIADVPSSSSEMADEESTDPTTAPEVVETVDESNDASGSGSSIVVVALTAASIVVLGVLVQLWLRRRNQPPKRDIDPDDPDDVQDLISSILD